MGTEDDAGALGAVTGKINPYPGAGTDYVTHTHSGSTGWMQFSTFASDGEPSKSGAVDFHLAAEVARLSQRVSKLEREVVSLWWVVILLCGNVIGLIWIVTR